MKNHIVFKFIAVLLCAASLLGIVGSALGAFVLTETGLNNKTVAQVRDAQIRQNAESFASAAALRYASQTLGGCPEEMVNDHFSVYWLSDLYEEGKYSYTLLDAEGNTVYSYSEPMTDGTTYRFPVSGQYLHMVSMETETEQAARLQAKAASFSASLVIGENAEVMDALPPEGRHVSYAAFYDPNGTLLYEAYDENSVGFLHYSQSGRVVFSGSQYVDDWSLMENTIAGAVFQAADGTVVYKASSVEGVGTITITAGTLTFTAGAYEPAAVAAAETQETPAETTQESLSADVIPIFYAAFYNSTDELVYEVYEETSIGFLSMDSDGRAVYRGFRPEAEPLAENTVITDVAFYGYNDTLIYEASAAEGVGAVTYTDIGQLVFTSSGPAGAFNPVVQPAAVETDTTEQTEATEETEAAEETEATEAAEETSGTEPAETEETQVQSSASGIPTAPSTEPVLINGKPLEEYQIEVDGYYDAQLDETVFVSYVYTPMPEYTVELYLAPDALQNEAEFTLLQILKDLSSFLLPALIICLLVFAISAVYLCCSAGRKPKTEEIRAGGLNCLPLDLYTGLILFGIVLAANVVAETAMYRLDENFLFSCGLVVATAFLSCLAVVAFGFALAAQVKTPGGYWWRNTLTVRFLVLFMHFGIWLEKFLAQKCFPALGRLCKKLWKLTIQIAVKLFHLSEKVVDWTICALRRFFRWLSGRLHRFFSLLPITWQWLVIGFAMFLLMAIVFATNGEEVLVVLCLGACVAIIVYGAHCFGILSESAKRMSKGDLDTKVDDRLLLGCFKDFAGDLNDLADVAVIAAQKQLKSERMKTELITNVSHDIKTPLTSIINYVDLLLKPHSEEDQAVYLEVLERQSLRLKKLIEDLMEMSKASTGNMAVEITTVDAVESVNQALGEFSDKLSAAQLTPVFRHAAASAAMMADGKLVWRVLSNILSNAVKYAMPGTRLYIDLMELEGKVVISLKNISREELNMDAEELMERFVRGDDSRNTEGSGLGLNIAKSLMELQKGQLQLLVDGDLFKVTLIFPGA